MIVIGGGLAGVEAAYAAARAGVTVDLYEMRPAQMTPAHGSGGLAELVCSNSLKSNAANTASGLLKAEMRELGSLVLRAAEETRVPAGNALAVDRERFATHITEAIEAEDNINLIREEVTAIPEGVAVIATGPLTSPAMTEALNELVGSDYLYFYDAISPTVAAESLDRKRAFNADRYDKGDADYVNCPMSKDEYYAFVDALTEAEPLILPDFEKEIFFEGCLPIEEIARRGRDSLRFGPLKPVGLEEEGERSFAVLQLRREDTDGQYLNLVGCQTRLRYDDQKRIFRMIPALAKAEFTRLGQAHRNTYVKGPACLLPTLQLRNSPDTLLAGQITGVEGYIESAALGIVAGMNAARLATGQRPAYPPRETIIGALLRHVSLGPASNFTPRNAAFGILPSPPLEARNKQERRKYLSERAMESLRNWVLDY
ncbi:MAG: methylenetetrahydrofolate--tRNA-(uracil(54)-C(5))-methyltransferase (FADH(2)-oxidizing) TrmFO [bacterium]|nr:methylenetetrahydrofolate--tRNA-(uracil(54)-C(5))-methyltransferase (FADH(2)-oxidizing) TrmFO [bacterium]